MSYGPVLRSLIRIKALTGKEFRQALRDPGSIMTAFVLPALLLTLFGYGVNMDARDLELGIALESGAPEAARLAGAFQATTWFRVSLARDRRELLDDLTSGRLRGVIIIPQDFADRLAGRRQAPVMIITDGSEINTANFLRNYTAGAIGIWQNAEARARGRLPASPVTITPRFWYNSELESRNGLLPGSIAIVMALVGTLLTSLVVAREWERGTMEALLSTPVSPLEFLISKAVPYFVMGLVSMTGAALAVVYIFSVPYRGGGAALMLAGGAFLLCALGQGLLISTLARNQFVACQVAMITAFLPAFILSGFIFEIASMPWIIRQISRVIPARYLVTNFQTLFLAGDIWAVLLPNIAFQLAIAALFLGLALRRTASRLEAC